MSVVTLPSVQAVAKAAAPPEVWVPPNTPVPDVHPVKGTNGKPAGHTPDPGKKWSPPADSVPPSGRATAVLGGAVAGKAAMAPAAADASPTALPSPPVQAGSLPVWIAPVAGAGTAAKSASSAPANDAPATAPTLQVDLADQGRTKAAGVNGALLALTDTGEGGRADRVQIGIDIQAWAKNAGADWGSRARIVQLPGCALTTPGAAGCATRTPVRSQRDGATGRLTVEVDVPQPAAAKPSAAKSFSAGAFDSPAAGSSTSVALAVEADAKGSGGDFTASPITPSASWQAGANAGNFTYGYTVELPSALAGSAPAVSLGYDSSAVDGKTASTNAQPSWIGDGWEWRPGSIVRGYKSCKDAGVEGSGDQCWGGDLLQLSLAGHAGQLVKDDKSCEWHLQGEDGTKVERLTGQSNGAWNGEAWRITTSDGTQYYFGANHLPGGDGTDQASNSVSTVPIYWPGGQDPCLKDGSPATKTWNQMGWQWSLDYVVDPHQNLITYRYEQEQNYYVQGGGQNNGNGPRTQYQRASYPTWVGYGQRLPDQIAAKGKANPAAQVWFRTAERCLPDSTFTCDPSQRTKDNAKRWPDTPIDQSCDATGDCTVSSPTFWTTKRLTKIDTEVWTGNSYRPVDSFALNQSFQDPGDGTSPALWLDSVQRTGSNGRTPITLPAVSFQPLQIANRVKGRIVRPDGTSASIEPYNRPRIQTITTETGGLINVVYAPAECSREPGGTMPASEDGNTKACMPVKWYLPGQSDPDPVNDWFNKILVQSVTQEDKVAGGNPVVVTTYVYGGGAAWHRNDSEMPNPKARTWDQFRGYATVTTLTGSGSDVEAPRTKSVATFLRGMDGDVLANGSTRQVSVKDVNGGSIKDENVLAGYIRDSAEYNGENGELLATTVSDPWIGPITATRAQSGGMPAITARAVNSLKVTNREKLANGWRTRERSTTYDSTPFARPLTVYDNGDLAHPEQLLCTSFEYATGPGGAPTQLASHTLVLRGACGQTPTKDNTVADTRAYFDGLPLGKAGAMSEQSSTEVLERYDGNGRPVYRTTGRATFDAYGRVTSTVDPSRTDATHQTGAETRTAYSPATGQLPTQVTHTNPMGWQTVSTLDVGRGSPLKIKDENGRISEQDFDSLGRAVAAWSPGNDRAKNPDRPNRKFSYAVNGANAPSQVLSQALMGDLKTYTSSFTIYDGLGRVRQTQASTPSGATGRMITDALFDSHGWQTKTSAAYYNDQAQPGGQLFLPNGGVQPDGKIPAQTVQKFDGMGRTVDSIFQSYGIEQWRTHTDFVGADEVRVTPPVGGYASATVKDARGNTVALRQYKSNTPTGAYDETTYGYSPEGKELWRKDAAGNTWSYEYDLLGRPVKTTDPDSGTGTTSYDDSKNLTTATDSRGKSATAVTDLLGRTVAAYEGTAVDPAKQVAGWTYDSLALGKPTSSTRYVGGASGSAYRSEITGYDVGYREKGSKTTIPATEGKLAGVYQSDNTYDAAGRLASTVMPGVPAANLGRETLNFTIDTGGQLVGLSSAFGFDPSTTYMADVRYDPYGRPYRTTVGGAGTQVVATMVIDDATGRVMRSILDKQTATTAHVDSVDFTYNPLGQVTSARNAQDGEVADLQCFTHDYLGRLTQAWTDTGTQTTKPQPSVPGIGACTNTDGPSIGGAPSVGGPAPYWQQYEYDLIGNRTKLVQKDVTGNADKDVTTTQTFGTGPNTPSSDPKTGGGTGGPHALMKSTRTGPAGTAVTSYTYDAAGNTTAITDTPGTRTLTWNAQGKLDQITGTGENGATSYLYDVSGNQLIRRDLGKTTLNLGADQITLDTNSGVVTDVRSYAASDGLSITRTTSSGSSTLAYQSADPHGTNGVQFDAGTLAHVRRPTDPFGNDRGTPPAAGVWAGDKGFVGGTKEKSTGFTLLGAREYDPGTGRFISPDPITDPGDPQQWNAYAYANNSPINKSDANGLRPTCDTPAECKGLEAERDNGHGYSYITPATVQPPSTAEEQTAVHAAFEAQKNLNETKRKRDELVHKVVDIVGDLIGFNDARDCFTKGDVMACINTALNVVPWGKILKAIKVGIQALKIYKEITRVFDAIRSGERAAKEAEAALVTARTAASEARAAERAAAKAAEEKAAKETATDAAGTESKAAAKEADDSAAASCPWRPNSFPTGTKVLMGDGTLKSIEDIHEGDVVMATDPQTGETHPEPVTATITTPDDKDFTDLTLTDDANPRGPPAADQPKITSTHHHPYWSETRKQWVDAGDLTPGEQLRRPDGTTLTIQSVRNYPYAVTTHNLTVSLLHTYYVLAGAAPVLVHNCGETGDEVAHVGDEAAQESQEKLLHGPFHRLSNGSSTQTVETLNLVESSGELWGNPSSIFWPEEGIVQAHRGPLPDTAGPGSFEFYTTVRPYKERATLGNQAWWPAHMAGVTSANHGDRAIIPVIISRTVR